MNGCEIELKIVKGVDKGVCDVVTLQKICVSRKDIDLKFVKFGENG